MLTHVFIKLCKCPVRLRSILPLPTSRSVSSPTHVDDRPAKMRGREGGGEGERERKRGGGREGASNFRNSTFSIIAVSCRSLARSVGERARLLTTARGARRGMQSRFLPLRRGATEGHPLFSVAPLLIKPKLAHYFGLNTRTRRRERQGENSHLKNRPFFRQIQEDREEEEAAAKAINPAIKPKTRRIFRILRSGVR